MYNNTKLKGIRENERGEVKECEGGVLRGKKFKENEKKTKLKKNYMYI